LNAKLNADLNARAEPYIVASILLHHIYSRTLEVLLEVRMITIEAKMANSTLYSAAVATTEEDRADDEYESPSSSSRRPGDDVFMFAEAQTALIPQEPPQEYVSEGLTWEDDYYNDKEDIVAVFDVDGKTVSDFDYSIVIRVFPAVWLFFLLLLGLLLFFALLFGDFYMWKYSVLCFVFYVPSASAIFFTSLARVLARCAKSEVHMAITSDCIQYDKESPDATVIDAHVKVS
jgi:hypothetical protein